MLSLCLGLFFVHLIAAIPSGGIVKGCSKSEIKSEACIRNGLDKIMSSLIKKWKENGNIDPLLVGGLDADYSNNASDIALLLEDVVVAGLSSTVLRQVNWKNLEEGKLELMCKTNWLSGTGSYWTEGYVSTFPAHSSGNFNITLKDLTSLLILHVDRTGPHLKITELILDTMPTEIHIKTWGQVDGNNALGKALNTFLNENSFELFELLKPKVLPYFSNKIKDMSNSLLLQIPAQ